MIYGGAMDDVWDVCNSTRRNVCADENNYVFCINVSPGRLYHEEVKVEGKAAAAEEKEKRKRKWSEGT